MKPKLIAGGAVMFGLGAVFGWAFTADRADEKVKNAENLADEMTDRLKIKVQRIGELEETLKSWRTWSAKNEEKEEELEREHKAKLAAGLPPEIEVHIPSDSNSDIIVDKNEIARTETLEEARANLQEIINRYTDDSEATAYFVNEGVKTVEGVENTPPFVISREKYSWDEEEGDEYSKITITYYPKQRVLLDDDEDPIEDVEGTVGWRNLRQFGGESGDPNVVFVRNRRLLTDFEVVQEDEEELPLHVKYGMPKAEFETNRAAGLIKFREGDV